MPATPQRPRTNIDGPSNTLKPKQAATPINNLSLSNVLTQGLVQRVQEGTHTLTSHDIVNLQHHIGNQAVQRMLSTQPAVAQHPHLLVQPKLQVGPANDRYEQEADRVASSVMRQITPVATSKAGGVEKGVQRSPDGAGLEEELEEEDEGIQRKITPIDNNQVRRKASGGVETSQSIGMEGGAIDARMESAIQRQRGGGRPLEESTRHKMESAFGSDFSGVKIHTNTQADHLNRSINADAFTTGQDMFFRSGSYAPHSTGGQKLIAHELTHVVQQTGKQNVQRKDRKPSVEVKGTLPSNRISTKARMMHLDFVLMKRQDADFKYIIGKQLGFKVKKRHPDGGSYGHYWTEIGDNEDSGFKPKQSYGWWPKDGVGGPAQVFKGVEGQLNQGEKNDPNQGQDAPINFHPVMKVDPDAESYDTIRARVTKEIEDFADDFEGTWNWRFGWGKNCQVFQDRLKKHVGLHYQKAKEWLRDPDIARRRQQAEKIEEQRVENVERATNSIIGEFTVPPNMSLEAYIETTQGNSDVRTFGAVQEGSGLRAGDQNVGATGRKVEGDVKYKYTTRRETLVEFLFEGGVYFMTEPYWEMYFGQPYPTAALETTGNTTTETSESN